MRKGVWGDCVANIVKWMPGSKVMEVMELGLAYPWFGCGSRLRQVLGLGFGVWGFSWVISKVRGYDVCRYVGLRVNKVVFTL